MLSPAAALLALVALVAVALEALTLEEVMAAQILAEALAAAVGHIMHHLVAQAAPASLSCLSPTLTQRHSQAA